MTKKEVYKAMDIIEGSIAFENAEHMINNEGFSPDELLNAYKTLGVFWAFAQKEDCKQAVAE